MPPVAIARRLCAALILMGLLATAPAKAEIEKFMRQCDGKLCASFRASITIPDGWVEDKDASNYFKAQMLLPKGLDFERAPAKIYAVVRYNRDKQPVSASCRTASRIGRAAPRTRRSASSMILPAEANRLSPRVRSPQPQGARLRIASRHFGW